ncbi:unnamed protein product [Scytosiphon promiscuus]
MTIASQRLVTRCAAVWEYCCFANKVRPNTSEPSSGRDCFRAPPGDSRNARARNKGRTPTCCPEPPFLAAICAASAGPVTTERPLDDGCMLINFDCFVCQLVASDCSCSIRGSPLCCTFFHPKTCRCLARFVPCLREMRRFSSCRRGQLAYVAE